MVLANANSYSPTILLAGDLCHYHKPPELWCKVVFRHMRWFQFGVKCVGQRDLTLNYFKNKGNAGNLKKNAASETQNSHWEELFCLLYFTELSESGLNKNKHEAQEWSAT